MGQHVALKVLLLLKGLFALYQWAYESPIVTLEMPVQLAFADELLVIADMALELYLLSDRGVFLGC